MPAATKYNDLVPIRVSPELAAHCRKTPERAAWLVQLADIVKALEHRWRLTAASPLDSEAPSCSYVSAVVTQNGTPALLKIGKPHMEGKHEVAGLRFWNGDPTVSLLESDEKLGAMVLERCRPGTTLRAIAEREQDVVMAGLLHRLWRLPSAPHSFRPLAVLMEYWNDETLAQAQHWFDAGLTREGLRLFKELPRDAAREVLLATDLHAGNVLRAEREPWLVHRS
jgi:streptomycin 6-kinase